MILGSTVRMLARQVPNYHLLAQSIAKGSLSVCSCRHCRWAEDGANGHLVCGRVAGRVEDDGWAIVALNGTCDRAEFRRGEEAAPKEKVKVRGEGEEWWLDL